MNLTKFAFHLHINCIYLQLPNATIDLEEYNLQIFLHSGGASRAYTLERKKPAWVLCTNETTSLGNYIYSIVI